ncbi:MAG: AAA family ATPase [Ilumatobacteraceae bacterium]
MLIGRQTERLALATAVGAARAGRAAVVVIVGEPGIGKTALLDDLRATTSADSRGPVVLTAAGTEAERAVPGAGLLTLLTPLRATFHGLHPPHGERLDTIATTGEVGSVPATGVALIELLTALGIEGPVVILLDDVQWIDAVSIEVLNFARRRLGGVAIVATARPGFEPWDQQVEIITLSGLDEGDTRDLLAACGSVSAEVAKHCRDACGGNPLALLELGRTLTADQRVGVRPLPRVVPVGDRLKSWLSTRVAGLPDCTACALATVALAGNVNAQVLSDALGRLELSLADLDLAEAAGVVVRNCGVVRFSHPLYAAIAADGAAPSRRRAIHRALAAAMPPEVLEHRAWHLADGFEDDPADALEALRLVAERASAQGAHLTASEAWERMATLTTDAEEQLSLFTAAGRAAWDSGRPELATLQLRAARELVSSGAVRAEATDVLGQTLGWSASIPAARQMLESEARSIEHAHPNWAVALLVSSARLASLAASSDAVLVSAEAERIAEAADDFTKVAARTMATHVRLLAGEGLSLGERLADLDVLGALIEDGVGRPLLELAQLLGFDLMVRERWTEARETFRKAGDTARSAALGGVEAFARGMAAEVAWRTGQWDRARAEASIDAQFNATFPALLGSFGDATLARVEAALGVGSESQQHAELAVARGDQVGMASLGAWGRHAVGLAALAAGQPDDALPPLEWIWRLERAGGATDPGVLWWHGDLLEALLSGGHRSDAARLLDQLDEAANATGRVWPAAIAARGRGILCGDPSVVGRSVQLLDRLGAPFEAARSQLAQAELLDGAERVATVELALTRFEVLGAGPWITRTRRLTGSPQLLGAPGAVTAMLSHGELRVALCVARGLTNRQAAQQLALSPRTVDAHLQSIYRKLDVRNRTQLSVRLGHRKADAES